MRYNHGFDRTRGSHGHDSMRGIRCRGRIKGNHSRDRKRGSHSRDRKTGSRGLGNSVKYGVLKIITREMNIKVYHSQFIYIACYLRNAF